MSFLPFFQGAGAVGRFQQTPQAGGPTKLTITNLEYGVSDSDVKVRWNFRVVVAFFFFFVI